jgi:hypothetical protein
MRRASGREVREWANSNGYDVGERGRFSQRLIDHFNTVHRPLGIYYQRASVAADTKVLRRVRDVDGEVLELKREAMALRQQVEDGNRLLRRLLRALGEDAA